MRTRNCSCSFFFSIYLCNLELFMCHIVVTHVSCSSLSCLQFPATSYLVAGLQHRAQPAWSGVQSWARLPWKVFPVRIGGELSTFTSTGCCILCLWERWICSWRRRDGMLTFCGRCFIVVVVIILCSQLASLRQKILDRRLARFSSGLISYKNEWQKQ